MNMYIRLVGIVGVATAVGVGTPVLGQPVGASASASASATMPALAREALDRAAKEYAGLRTYQDRMVNTMVIVRKDAQGTETASEDHASETMTWFEQPRKFKLGMNDMQVISDGSSVYTVWESENQYLEEPFPADVSAAMDSESTYFVRATMSPALVALLRRPASGAEFFRDHIKITGAVEDMFDGEECIRLDGTATDRHGGEETTPTSYWFSRKTGLLVRITSDGTERYRERMEMMGDEEEETIVRAGWDMRLTDVRTDEAIDLSVFRPAEGTEKVTEFAAPDMDVDDEFEDEEEEGEALLGQPAPAFEGKLLDGSNFDLGSLKGRVVVMDFWATWCPPCVVSIPSIQKMSEKYADQPVTVIGINQDQQKTKTVQSFVDKKKITFAQVMDDGSIGNSYHVTGIPTTVILDKEGVVQYVHVGGSATIGDELGEKVDRLLKGEKLVDPAAPKVKKAAAPVLPALEEKEPARLEEGKRSNVQAMPMGMGRSVNPAGGDEFIVPTPEGLIAVISSDTSVKTVRLAGAGVGRAMIQSARRAKLGGQQGWLVEGTSFGQNDSRAIVRFHDEQGKLLWEFSPPGVKGTFANAHVDIGDVTGQGEDQVVVAFATLSRSGGGSRNNAWLVVLNAKGEPIITKKVGNAAYGVWIAKGTEPGKAGTVVLLDGSVRRFTFNTKAERVITP